MSILKKSILTSFLILVTSCSLSDTSNDNEENEIKSSSSLITSSSVSNSSASISSASSSTNSSSSIDSSKLSSSSIYIPTSSSSSSSEDTAAIVKYRQFKTSFESVSDFDGFYIVAQNTYDSNHELSDEIVFDGSFSHKAWILQARDVNNDGATYKPHRAYPTIQLYKTPEGSFNTPCIISLYVYLDMPLANKPEGNIDDWVSFVTLSPDSTDNWSRTILVNLGPDGYLRLMHVPNQGEAEYQFQMSPEVDTLGQFKFPQKEWVNIQVYLDLDPNEGFAKLYQNGYFISHAKVSGGQGKLAQAHFGLYAAAAISEGVLYNDLLTISEVNHELDY